MTHSLKNKLIGDKAFYKMVMAVAVPIMIQNGITNFVGLLDNIMVGLIGTEQMSGVAIANQLIFIFNLCIFGALSGAGIFGAQFYGKGDHEGVRYSFRFKLFISIALCAVATAVFSLFGSQLISLYLSENDAPELIAATLKHGKNYLVVMIFGLLPFALSQVYSGTLRECGETMLPMKAGIIAVFVNLVLNYVFIFGKLGFPAMGGVGAALATVVSRYVELLIIVIVAHKNKLRFPFLEGAYKSVYIPGRLTKQIIIKGMPLLLNESAWSIGRAFITQLFSVRGLAVIAGMNISNTVGNLFNVVYFAMGNAIAIIVGQLLGAGKDEEAKDTDTKLIFFSIVSCLLVSVGLVIASPFIPMIYNTTDEVRHLASWFIIITAICTPLFAFANSCYFTLRSGGKTVLTFLFDSVFVWVVNIPMTFALVYFTDLHILPLYFIVQFSDIIKCIFGYILVKKGIWIQNVVSDQQ